MITAVPLVLALTMSSRHIGNFLLLPDGFPESVPAVATIGSDERAGAGQPVRIADPTNHAAVAALIDAYYERAFAFSDVRHGKPGLDTSWVRDYGPTNLFDEPWTVWVTNCVTNASAAAASNARVFSYGWTTNLVVLDGVLRGTTNAARRVPDGPRLLEAGSVHGAKDGVLAMLRYLSTAGGSGGFATDWTPESYAQCPPARAPVPADAYVYKSNAWASARALFVGTSFAPGWGTGAADPPFDLPADRGWEEEWPFSPDIGHGTYSMDRLADIMVPFSAIGFGGPSGRLGMGGACDGGFLYNVWMAVAAGTDGVLLNYDADSYYDDPSQWTVSGNLSQWWKPGEDPVDGGRYGETFLCTGTVDQVLLRAFPCAAAGGPFPDGLEPDPSEGIGDAADADYPEIRLQPDDGLYPELAFFLEGVLDAFFQPAASNVYPATVPAPPGSSGEVFTVLFSFEDDDYVTVSRDGAAGLPVFSGSFTRNRISVPGHEDVPAGKVRFSAPLREDLEPKWRDGYWDQERYKFDFAKWSETKSYESYGGAARPHGGWTEWDGVPFYLEVYRRVAETNAFRRTMSQAALASRLLALADRTFEIPLHEGTGTLGPGIGGDVSWWHLTTNSMVTEFRAKLDIGGIPPGFFAGDTMLAPVTDCDIDTMIRFETPQDATNVYNSIATSGSYRYDPEGPETAASVRAKAGFSGTGGEVLIRGVAATNATELTSTTVITGGDLYGVMGEGDSAQLVLTALPEGMQVRVQVVGDPGYAIDKTTEELEYLTEVGVPCATITDIALVAERFDMGRIHYEPGIPPDGGEYAYRTKWSPVGPGAESAGSRNWTEVVDFCDYLVMKDHPYDEGRRRIEAGGREWVPYCTDDACIPPPRIHNDLLMFTPFEAEERYRNNRLGRVDDGAGAIAAIRGAYDGYRTMCRDRVLEDSEVDEWSCRGLFGQLFPLSNALPPDRFYLRDCTVARVEAARFGKSFTMSGGVIRGENGSVIREDDVVYGYAYSCVPGQFTPEGDPTNYLARAIFKPAVLATVRSVPVIVTDWNWKAVSAVKRSSAGFAAPGPEKELKPEKATKAEAPKAEAAKKTAKAEAPKAARARTAPAFGARAEPGSLSFSVPVGRVSGRRDGRVRGPVKKHAHEKR